MTDNKRRWEGVVINIEKGDVITSKKGILTRSALRKRMVTNKKIKYLGDGLWEALDNAVVINDVKVVK